MQVTHNSEEKSMQNYDRAAAFVNNLICLISSR